MCTSTHPQFANNWHISDIITSISQIYQSMSNYNLFSILITHSHVLAAGGVSLVTECHVGKHYLQAVELHIADMSDIFSIYM